MIKIQSRVIKNQPNFWNQALFHPTDAVEDPWGKRILDRMANDGAIKTIRIYSMFEDIVYLSENGELCYDFRVSDLRIDYLLKCGYNLLIAYGGIPDCIAGSLDYKECVSKNKTRYKGKMWNTSLPRDLALWEEICYEYTKHNVERYGIETVASWRLQCFNEPDSSSFFLSEYPSSVENRLTYRLPAYCRLYAAFERGIRRVSDRIAIGGPALAFCNEFLGGFLDYVKENRLKLDFVSVHNYGTTPKRLNEGLDTISVSNNLKKHLAYVETVKSHGFGELPLLVDEWGFSASGFFNREECPALMARETEVFSAYFARLIHDFIFSDFKVDMLCICLSGQHEMVEDFTGFRNFLTLNFIAKPIYNAYILTSRLGERLLAADKSEQNLHVIPTKNGKGDYAVLLSYSEEDFNESIPTINETLSFEEDITEKTVSLWCIDREHTNPYRAWVREGEPKMTEETIKRLREEGQLKPLRIQSGNEPITLELTANSTYLITVEG